MDVPTYLWLPPGSDPPDLTIERPFKAVVVIDADVTDAWRTTVSDWLVRSGCLYAIAWGRDCSLWDDSIDWAILELFDYGEIPDDRFVMTTWHEDEPLSEAFWFCQNNAAQTYADQPLTTTLILDIVAQPREAEMQAEFSAAQANNH